MSYDTIMSYIVSDNFMCVTNLYEFIKTGLLINFMHFGVLSIATYGVIKFYALQIYATGT